MALLVVTFVLGLVAYYLLSPGEVKVVKRKFKDEIFELPKLDGVSKDYISYLISHSTQKAYLEPIWFYLTTPSKVYNLSDDEVKQLQRSLIKKEQDIFFKEWKQSMIGKFKLKKRLG